MPGSARHPARQASAPAYTGRMTRSSPLLRCMLLLASVAMLLAAAAPAVSRILSPTERAAPMLVEMCTTGGLRLLALDGAPEGARDPVPAPQPAMDEACGYCTLPPPLPGAVAASPARPGWHAASAVPVHAAHATRTWRNLHGLGAQGPPVST